MKLELSGSHIDLRLNSIDLNGVNFYDWFCELRPKCSALVDQYYNISKLHLTESRGVDNDESVLAREFELTRFPSLNLIVLDANYENDFNFKDGAFFSELILLVEGQKQKKIAKYINSTFFSLIENYEDNELKRIKYSEKTASEKQLNRSQLKAEINMFKAYHKELLLIAILEHYARQDFKIKHGLVIQKAVIADVAKSVNPVQKKETKQNRMRIDAALVATFYIFESLGAKFTDLRLEDKVGFFEFLSGFGELKTKIENRTVTRKIIKYWPESKDSVGEFSVEDLRMAKKYLKISGLEKPLKKLERDFPKI